jgi:hypothetical protein
MFHIPLSFLLLEGRVNLEVLDCVLLGLRPFPAHKFDFANPPYARAELSALLRTGVLGRHLRNVLELGNLRLVLVDESFDGWRLSPDCPQSTYFLAQEPILALGQSTRSSFQAVQDGPIPDHDHVRLAPFHFFHYLCEGSEDAFGLARQFQRTVNVVIHTSPVSAGAL